MLRWISLKLSVTLHLLSIDSCLHLGVLYFFSYAAMHRIFHCALCEWMFYDITLSVAFYGDLKHEVETQKAAAFASSHHRGVFGGVI